MQVNPAVLNPFEAAEQQIVTTMDQLMQGERASSCHIVRAFGKLEMLVRIVSLWLLAWPGPLQCTSAVYLCSGRCTLATAGCLQQLSPAPVQTSHEHPPTTNAPCNSWL